MHELSICIYIVRMLIYKFVCATNCANGRYKICVPEGIMESSLFIAVTDGMHGYLLDYT
jgi:hypothetical protein